MIDTFAFYFPQFYSTVENSEWWGEGFTDWDLVRDARPQFPMHNQPRLPTNGYVNQSNPSVIASQAELARDYSLTGFNFYHYWFNGKPYLDIPIKNLLGQPSVNIKFMMTWANESWTRQWIGKPNEFLIKQNYYSNDFEIVSHYDYLSRFFQDDRYYKINNKPVLNIYRPELIPLLHSVLSKFDDLAKKDGFDGLYFIACRSYDISNADNVYKHFDAIMNFNPRYAINFYLNKSKFPKLEKIARSLPESIQSTISRFRKNNSSIKRFDYNGFISSLMHSESFVLNKPVYHSVFPDWDNTARYGERATLFDNVSVENYREALSLAIGKLSNSHQPLLFINAWNEWSESAYLEPDDKRKNAFLEVTQSVLSTNRSRR